MLTSFRENHLLIRGLKTSWHEGGRKGRTLLYFLHGFPDDAHVWDPLMQLFAKSYRVVAPMIRGAGGSASSVGLGRFTPEALALDNLAILKHLDPSGKLPIVLIGHDLGGAQAWYLAPLLGRRLKSLIVINSADMMQMWNRRKNFRQIAKSWYVSLMWMPGVPELLWRFLQKPLVTLAHRMGGMPDGKNIPHGEKAILHQTMKQYRAFAWSFLTRELGQSRFNLKSPVLVIHGREDAFLVPACLDEFVGIADRVTVRTIPGKHWLQLEQTEKIYHLIAFFLTEQQVAA